MSRIRVKMAEFDSCFMCGVAIGAYEKLNQVAVNTKIFLVIQERRLLN